jgi:hypothetical protein
MKPSPRNLITHLRSLSHSGLLLGASLLVPANQRAEWRREWRGELWHVQQSCAPGGACGWQDERAMAAFCLGAFQDALCIRRSNFENKPFFAQSSGTPGRCLLALLTMLAAAYALALWLPGVAAERGLWPRKVSPNLVFIERATSHSLSAPSITPRQFRSWEGRRQKYFDAFAFFSVSAEQVASPSTGLHRKANTALNVARASANLFTLLGLSVHLTNPLLPDAMPEIVLSERTWKTQFAADPHIAGTIVRFVDRSARVAGVAPDGSLALPGRVDAWEFPPSAGQLDPPFGYVVAHLTDEGKAEMWANRVAINASQPDGTEDDLLGIAIEEWRPSPINLYLFAVLLGLLALPAITTVSLGESSLDSQQTSWWRKLVRWSFFSTKIGLLFPIIYFVSFDLAYGDRSLGREGAIYIQLISTFSLCLFGMRWVLKDQRQRCPVCVRTVCHPAHVGQASWTFLDWNGTEMVCMGGHTMLHVPSLPTSWFGSQRWLYLDTSWQFLFAGSTRPIP